MNERGVIVNIQRQAGREHHRRRDRIEALLPQLRASLPASVKLTVLNRSHDDDPRLRHDVEFELISRSPSS